MSEDSQTTKASPVSGSMIRTGYSFDTIALARGTASECRAVLELRTGKAPEVYRGRPFVLDVSAVQDLSAIDYPALCAVAREFGMFLLGLSGAATEERALALSAKGIPVVNSSRFARMREESVKPRIITRTVEVKVPVQVELVREVKVPTPVREGVQMCIVRRNVRSGEAIKAPGNSVAVFGSVANGARIIASYNILVFGDLMGEVYAGSPRDSGDPGAPDSFIYAEGSFSPTFVAIAGNYQTADDMENDPLGPAVREGQRGTLAYLKGRALRYCEARDFAKIISNTERP
ncbi:MAG: septum site-determining protein MinC [Succinivibrio sp.]